MNQRALVVLEVAQQLADGALETTDAGHVTQVLALRPVAQGGKFAPASQPVPMPQAPLGTLEGVTGMEPASKVSVGNNAIRGITSSSRA